MKENELRIGNWVTAPAFELPFQIDLLALSQAKNCDPIPLTDQWLKDFGLQRNSDGSIFSFIEEQRVGGSDLTIRNYHTDNYSLWFGDVDMMELDIEYVHELQNLYFALTNKELTK